MFLISPNNTDATLELNTKQRSGFFFFSFFTCHTSVLLPPGGDVSWPPWPFLLPLPSFPPSLQNPEFGGFSWSEWRNFRSEKPFVWPLSQINKTLAVFVVTARSCPAAEASVSNVNPPTPPPPPFPLKLERRSKCHSRYLLISDVSEPRTAPLVPRPLASGSSARPFEPLQLKAD